MILDTLENGKLYESVHPRFKKAFEFLNTTDLVNLPLGKIELEGSSLIVNVVEIPGKTVEVARMETHNKYIDIQIPISKVEKMGWIAGSKLKKVTDSYNQEKDITFFEDKATNFIEVQPLDFAVFFPEDGHQPGIVEGVIKKIIVKVLV